MKAANSEVAIGIAALQDKTEVSEVQRPSWGPLVKVCALYGIGRTRAFELARAEVLETFLLGRRRFVYVASVERLPQTFLNLTGETNENQSQ